MLGELNVTTATCPISTHLLQNSTDNVLQTFVTVSCTRTSVLMVSRYLNTVFIFLSNILNRIILKMHPKKVSFKSNVTARFPDETLLSKEFVKSDGIA